MHMQLSLQEHGLQRYTFISCFLYLATCLFLCFLFILTQICDFGCAKQFDHTTVISAVVGTYQWMAPEVIIHFIVCDYQVAFIMTLHLNFPHADNEERQGGPIM